jgi:hypothetical protein
MLDKEEMEQFRHVFREAVRDGWRDSRNNNPIPKQDSPEEEELVRNLEKQFRPLKRRIFLSQFIMIK